MSNVLDDEKQIEIRALGRLGWTLSRIQAATGIRRETISGYLKAAGIPVRQRGRPSESKAKPAICVGVSTDPGAAKPATTPEVSTDLPPEFCAAAEAAAARSPTASACEPYRDVIEEALGRGRDAMAIWQDLVTYHAFTARYASVKRFVVGVRSATTAEARAIIVTAPGEDCGERDVMVNRTDRDCCDGSPRGESTPLCFP